MSFHLSDYLPILLMFIVAGGFAVGNVLLSQFVGQRKRTRTKLMPYECGKDPVGSARERFSVKFYLIAMIFLLFDIEVAFLYPWAMAMRELSWPGLIQIVVFFLILVVGYVYIWRKGVLNWGPEFDADYKHAPKPGPAIVKRYRYGHRN